MNKNKIGLGRGLDALINPRLNNSIENPLAITAGEIRKDDGRSYDILIKIPILSITPNPYQPRTEFNEEALEELKKSILANGLIQPVTVRRKEESGKFELISGERRLRACRDIGFREIPAYVIKVESTEAMLALSLIENIQREQLNAIEEAMAYKRLMEECSLSQEEIAERVGKNRTTITNSMRVLKLPKTVQESLSKEEISAGHARALIPLNDDSVQFEILKKIIKEGLSVRQVEALVKSFLSAPENNKHSSTNQSDSLETITQKDIEAKLRGIFGTKVICRQKKDGTGQVVFEFYSNDELDRLFDLFDIVAKNNY